MDLPVTASAPEPGAAPPDAPEPVGLRRERWVTVVALLMLALVLGIAFRAWLHPDMLLEVAGLVFCN